MISGFSTNLYCALHKSLAKWVSYFVFKHFVIRSVCVFWKCKKCQKVNFTWIFNLQFSNKEITVFIYLVLVYNMYYLPDILWIFPKIYPSWKYTQDWSFLMNRNLLWYKTLYFKSLVYLWFLIEFNWDFKKLRQRKDIELRRTHRPAEIWNCFYVCIRLLIREHISMFLKSYIIVRITLRLSANQLLRKLSHNKESGIIILKLLLNILLKICDLK